MQINEEPMVLGRLDQLTYMPIWEPKYSAIHDKEDFEVWVLKRKIDNSVTPHIKIEFTKTKSKTFEGLWYISKQRAKTFPVGWNGSAKVYKIPFNQLRRLVINQKDLRSLI